MGASCSSKIKEKTSEGKPKKQRGGKKNQKNKKSETPSAQP